MDAPLATKLRILRAERGITLREAGKLTNVRPSTLSLLERGKTQPHDVTMARIARGYNVRVEDLLEADEAGKAGAPKGLGSLARFNKLRQSGEYAIRVKDSLGESWGTEALDLFLDEDVAENFFADFDPETGMGRAYLATVELPDGRGVVLRVVAERPARV